MTTSKRWIIFFLFLGAIAFCLPDLFGYSVEADKNFDWGANRKSKNLSDVASATVARENLDVYSRTESDALAAQSTLRYSFTETNSDIATDSVTYEYMATSSSAIQASESLSLALTNSLLDAWVTPAGTPNLDKLVAGKYEVEFYFSKTGPGTANLYTELWGFAADGATGTIVASSAVTILSGTIDKQLSISRITLLMDAQMLHSDRLALKLYGYRSGVASITIWYGGTTDSFFGVPISPRNFLRVDGSNADTAAEVRTNIGLGSMSTQNADTVAITGGVATLTGLEMNAGNIDLNGNYLSGDGDSEGISIDIDGNVGMGILDPTFLNGGGLEIMRLATATLRIQNYNGGNNFELHVSSEAAGIHYYGLNNSPHYFWINGGQVFSLRTDGIASFNYSIEVAGTVDGVDLAAASSAFDAHVIDNSSVHGVSVVASQAHVDESIATHAALMAAHGSTVIASQSYVDGRITEADASYTLSLNFATDSVATHSILNATHGSSVIASAAHVDQSIATHALLMASHGCAAIASEAYVDAAVASAGSGDVSGNEYRLAADTASEPIYLSGTDLGIAVASGSAVRFEIDFIAVASATDTKWGGKVQGMAIASGAIAYLAGSEVTDTWPLDPGALGIVAGIAGGEVGLYASGTAGSLWKAVRVKSWSLDDEP